MVRSPGSRFVLPRASTLGLLLSLTFLQPPLATAAPPPAGPASRITDRRPPAQLGAMAPSWAQGTQEPALSWLETVDGGAKQLRLAFLRADGWSEPTTIASGTDFFANWADLPGVGASADGALVAHWLARSGAGTYAYGISLARSTDGGRSWHPLGRLNDDTNPKVEHGFVSYAPTPAGLRAFWLDGRNVKPDGSGAMSLRTALVGATIGASQELDARVCDCCQTGAAETSSGPLVVFRDRSPEEVRDIAIIRAEGGGWTSPTSLGADHWRMPGCPVNGPAVAATGDRVVVAWYSGNPTPRVQVTWSLDGGRHFGTPVLVDGGGPLGRVAVALEPTAESSQPTQAVVSWLAAVGDEAEVRLVRVGSDGRLGAPFTITRTSAARSSGFPRLLTTSGRALIAWLETSAGKDSSRLEVSEIALSDLAALPKPTRP